MKAKPVVASQSKNVRHSCLPVPKEIKTCLYLASVAITRTSSLSQCHILCASERSGLERMERQTQDLPTWLLVFISPTRVLFERFNSLSIQRWSTLFLVLNTAFLFLLPLVQQHWSFWRGLASLVWLLPFSRTVEIVCVSKLCTHSTTTPSINCAAFL